MQRGIGARIGGSVGSMVSDNQRKLEQRVVRAAEVALDERRFVTEARQRVRPDVQRILDTWQSNTPA